MGAGPGKIRPAAARRIARRHQEEPPRNLNSYRITKADRLGEGWPEQKFQQNLKAIETFRALDAEERPATAEEKTVLVKYVGWGAMPQVFDDYNREWAKERATLQSNLAEEEYEHARSTTLNAHYTSLTVIDAMYRAVERFGVKGARPRTGVRYRPLHRHHAGGHAETISRHGCRN